VAGILAWSRPSEDGEREVAAMVDALFHRGPDDGGVAAGDGWAIGMRRLAIIDLSAAGHQPMASGDHVLVFNGEVYNFAELREELAALGHTFRGGSDTEVVLEAFREWGPAALERFNGFFALCVVDTRRRVAWLARDRFGKKPLFLARLRGRLMFASELKAMLPLCRDEVTLDRDALAGYLRYQYVPGPSSILREVEKLPPASWLEVDLQTGLTGEPQVYWEPPAPDPTLSAATPGEVLDIVREATARRMVADVPVGAFLSGGTDSSLVVACMRAVSDDVRTFAIGFREGSYDESGYAAAVAQHLGTRHTTFTLSGDETLKALPAFVEAFEDPFADTSAIATYAVARLAREHVTVALTGDGGDELFGGYTRYMGVGARVEQVERVPRAAAPVLARGRHLPRVGPRLDVLASAVRLGTAAAAYRETVSIWRTPDLRRLVPDAPEHDALLDIFDAAAGGPVERLMRCDIATYLIDDILQKVDRATMAVSLEARNPLLDPAVVAVAMRSTEYAEEGPGRKPLLRDALRLVLPDELVDRPKMGFTVPHTAWLQGELKELLHDLVLSGPDELYRRSTARSVNKRLAGGSRLAGHQLWCLLVFELWRDHWLRGRPLPALAA
jgi:asparagine synthase (glutamine-hydrolysing)